MFYLCESATTATMFYLCESATTATTKAAHRTPQRKHPAGTEINPRYDKVSFLNKI
ncbi:hypothetical protein [Lysinibacillus xylanilyticus]|uniref:hypothetical protein n=1 Tax=Lysinibacillus xylanilyticus TaxID=582475 RepID=UPI003D01C0AB